MSWRTRGIEVGIIFDAEDHVTYLCDSPEDVFDVLYSNGYKVEAMEGSSWAELATVPSSYEGDGFIIYMDEEK